MTKSLSISLIIVSLIVGIGIGFMISPEYASMSMEDSEHSADLGNSDSKYDLRFIDAMIAHHLGALEMAKVASKESKNSEIIKLAENIIVAQEKEIDQMYEWKKDWYDNSKEVKLNENYSMDVNLGNHDERFDKRFINAMIAHHAMAIEMAEDAQKKSTRNEILNLADAIIEDQKAEMEKMEVLRSNILGD